MKEIKELYKSIKDTPYPEALIPSRGWQDIISHVLESAINESKNELQFLERIQESPQFSIPRKNDDLISGIVVRDYRKHFGVIDGESIVTCNPKLIFGKLESTNFYWNHGVITSIARFANLQGPTVLEIGGGYGELARQSHNYLKTKTHIIVDLIESSICQYVYLKNNFPQSKILFVEKKQSIQDINQYDFVICPSPFIECLVGINVDIAINVSSFGEMRQQTVNYFVYFIENLVKAKYFYSLNRERRHQFRLKRFVLAVLSQIKTIREGKAQYHSDLIKQFFYKHLLNILKNPRVLFDFPPREFISLDTSSVTLPISPNKWKTSFTSWNEGFYQIEPNHPAFREILLTKSVSI